MVTRGFLLPRWFAWGGGRWYTDPRGQRDGHTQCRCLNPGKKVKRLLFDHFETYLQELGHKGFCRRRNYCTMAVYEYEFDDTKLGDFRYDRDDCVLVQEALKLLEDKLRSWNEIAMTHGALEEPYRREADDIRGMIEWVVDRLSTPEARVIRFMSVSTGSARYLQAALIHAAWLEEKKITEAVGDTWLSAVVGAVRGKAKQYHDLAKDIPVPPAAILEEIRSEYGTIKTEPRMEGGWDAFVCHASEDKDAFVRPLVEALRARHLSIWYDDFTLRVGDSLRRSIDRGLARSRFGVVILSENFFAKEWPQRELDGLVAREINGRKVVLPVWHGIDEGGIRNFSPMLADRVGISSQNGIAVVVKALMSAMEA